MIFKWYKNAIIILASSGIVIAGESEMVKKNSLKKYSTRRDLKKSGEPKGGEPTKKGDKIFVIQKHDASHLHYDFRIEIDGVLKSWAVPKGPSLNPGVKRLAMPTDDHPMGYATFEGTIPEGSYGAGEVIVWDTGTYTNIKEKDGKLVPMKECFKMGTIEIFLHGKKLKGGFALIKTHLHDADAWLLIKMKDEYADARANPVSSKPESALSGKTIEDVRSENGKAEPKKSLSKKTSKKKVKKNKK